VCASLSLLPHNTHSHKSRVLKARALSSPPKGRTTTTTTPEAFQYYRERERERDGVGLDARGGERSALERDTGFFFVWAFFPETSREQGVPRTRATDETTKDLKKENDI
jgi:hypothetical protein